MRIDSDSSKNGNSAALRDFKQRAKLLKRELGVSHMEALEALAEREGYLDYEHARQVLSDEQ